MTDTGTQTCKLQRLAMGWQVSGLSSRLLKFEQGVAKYSINALSRLRLLQTEVSQQLLKTQYNCLRVCQLRTVMKIGPDGHGYPGLASLASGYCKLVLCIWYTQLWVKTQMWVIPSISLVSPMGM